MPSPSHISLVRNSDITAVGPSDTHCNGEHPLLLNDHRGVNVLGNWRHILHLLKDITLVKMWACQPDCHTDNSKEPVAVLVLVLLYCHINRAVGKL